MNELMFMMMNNSLVCEMTGITVSNAVKDFILFPLFCNVCTNIKVIKLLIPTKLTAPDKVLYNLASYFNQ